MTGLRVEAATTTSPSCRRCVTAGCRRRRRRRRFGFVRTCSTLRRDSDIFTPPPTTARHRTAPHRRPIHPGLVLRSVERVGNREFTTCEWNALSSPAYFLSRKERKGKEEYLYSAFLAKVVHSKRSGMDHTVLSANNTMPAFPS